MRVDPRLSSPDRSKPLSRHWHFKAAVCIKSMLVSNGWPEHQEPRSLLMERALLQSWRKKEANEPLPDKKLSGRSSFGNPHVGGNDSPSSFAAKRWNPLFILQIGPAKFVTKRHDFIPVSLENGVECRREPWRQIIVDHDLHATASRPICRSKASASRTTEVASSKILATFSIDRPSA